MAQRYVGVWDCGPTVMHGANSDVSRTTRTINNRDGSYSTLSTSLITPHGGTPVTNLDITKGGWQIVGEVVTSTVEDVMFVSSTDPAYSRDEGQRVLEAEAKKRSVFESRILEIDDRSSRAVPVSPKDKEAEVVSTCKRV
ncbi:MAG TPA: hypothetical protein VGC74_10320 [Stenotrophomonas sp.]